MTLRDVQGNEKAGQPWKRLKRLITLVRFPGFISAWNSPATRKIQRWAERNGEQRQQGSTAEIIHKIVPLIAYMSKFFTLKAGDVVLTARRWRRPVAKR
ncbi:fumarylacetoacetate hydrolase family protein [Shigella flexneri]